MNIIGTITKSAPRHMAKHKNNRGYDNNFHDYTLQKTSVIVAKTLSVSFQKARQPCF